MQCRCWYRSICLADEEASVGLVLCDLEEAPAHSGHQALHLSGLLCLKRMKLVSLCLSQPWAAEGSRDRYMELDHFGERELRSTSNSLGWWLSTPEPLAKGARYLLILNHHLPFCEERSFPRSLTSLSFKSRAGSRLRTGHKLHMPPLSKFTVSYGSEVGQCPGGKAPFCGNLRAWKDCRVCEAQQ